MRRRLLLVFLPLVASCVAQETPTSALPPSTTSLTSIPTTVPAVPDWEPDPTFTLRVGVTLAGLPPSNPWQRTVVDPTPPQAGLEAPSIWYGAPGEVSLYRLVPPGRALIPMLAAQEQPPVGEISGRGWVIEVDIRDGVLWSDGEPLDAGDVAFSFGILERLGLLPDGLASTEAVGAGRVRFIWRQRPTMAEWHYGSGPVRHPAGALLGSEAAGPLHRESAED